MGKGWITSLVFFCGCPNFWRISEMSPPGLQRIFTMALWDNINSSWDHFLYLLGQYIPIMVLLCVKYLSPSPLSGAFLWESQPLRASSSLLQPELPSFSPSNNINEYKIGQVSVSNNSIELPVFLTSHLFKSTGSHHINSFDLNENL